MNTKSVEAFNIIGISVRTTNENGQSATDIPRLWNQFFSENRMNQIPNKTDGDIYCVYTDYEKDHTQPYTTIIGCRVGHLNDIPAGFVGKSMDGGLFEIFQAKGKMNAGIVFQEWIKIWNADIPRAYTNDFEVYGKKAEDPENAAVDIFIAVNG